MLTLESCRPWSIFIGTRPQQCLDDKYTQIVQSSAFLSVMRAGKRSRCGVSTLWLLPLRWAMYNTDHYITVQYMYCYLNWKEN